MQISRWFFIFRRFYEIFGCSFPLGLLVRHLYQADLIGRGEWPVSTANHVNKQPNDSSLIMWLSCGAKGAGDNNINANEYY